MKMQLPTDSRLSALNSKRGSAIAMLLAFLFIQSAFAQQWELERNKLSSPSGEYELQITPRNPEGRGPGRYTMKRGKAVVWSGERPLCLRGAEVLDDGRVVGYAYRGGVKLAGSHGLRYRGLTVVILDSKGEFQLRDPGVEHETGRIDSASNMAHSDSPQVRGFLVDLEHDRFTLRVSSEKSEHACAWWTYRLSTGEKLGDVIPAQPISGRDGISREVSVQTVPGTSLTLVHWYIHRWASKTRDAALSLINRKGKTVWSKILPAEYDLQAGTWNWWQLLEAETEQIVAQEKSFSFRPIDGGQVMEFSVKVDVEGPLGWRVSEESREDD